MSSDELTQKEMQELIRSHQKKIDSVDVSLIKQHIKAMEKDVRLARERVSLEIVKNATISEVMREVARSDRDAMSDVFIALTDCMDAPFEWWKMAQDWSIAQWVRYLKSHAVENMESRYE